MNPGSAASKPILIATLLTLVAVLFMAGAWYAAVLGVDYARAGSAFELAAGTSRTLSAVLAAGAEHESAYKRLLTDSVHRLDGVLGGLQAGGRVHAAGAVARWQHELRASVIASESGRASPAQHRRLAGLMDDFAAGLRAKARAEAALGGEASIWRNALAAATLLCLAGLFALVWRYKSPSALARHPGNVDGFAPTGGAAAGSVGQPAPVSGPELGDQAVGTGLGGTEAAISQSQTSLELWHGVLTRLLEDPDSVEPFILLLREIEELTGAMSSAIVVTAGQERQTVLLACTYAKDRERFAAFARNPPADMRVAGYGEVRIYDDPSVHGYRFVASRLRQGELGYGFLLLRVPSAIELSHTEIALLNIHGERLASIIYGTRRARQTLRVAQYQERAAIARELHDSLAQSLSYLKIQAARLQSLMGRDETAAEHEMHDEVDSVLQELRENLNVAYRQLRELITTFRLTMRGRSFAQALEDSVDEFAKRSSIAFDVDNRLPGGVLSVAEELQLLQIIREALSNAVRHSHANYVEVSVSSASDGILRVTIDDDGIGADPSRRRPRNHGIIIMQERAQSLKGEMRIENAPGGGTRVLVQFRPSKYSGAPPAVI